MPVVLYYGDSMHENSKLLFERHALGLFKPEQKVLEIGPDSFPSTYRKGIPLDLEWHTLDRHNNPKLTYSGTEEYQFPIPDDFYDITLSGQVIEHVRKPWRWLPELVRVTRRGGYIITINPVSWPYHEVPVDCWRAYPEGMRALYDEAGLEVTHSSWGSLEAPGFRNYIPGQSAPSRFSYKRRLLISFLDHFGVPLERAYDTITIGRKPR